MRRLAWPSVLPWGLAVVLGWPAWLLAAERLTIGQLHQYHASYHTRVVTVVGKVEDMQAFPPMRVATARCNTLYGRAQFLLIDETGSLSVESVGSCFPAAMTLPHDGDQIELTAMILVYVPDGQTAQVMKAITHKIVVLQEHTEE